jgi:hypothetical protein
MLNAYDGRPIPGQLIYRYSEHSFDVEPQPRRGVTSLLVNDLQIEIDEDGRLMYVWGLCSYQSWVQGSVDVPAAKSGCLHYVDKEVIPGVSRRLNSEKHWAVTYDAKNGWLWIGAEIVQDKIMAFAPGAVAALRHGELTGLWLHPRFS